MEKLHNHILRQTTQIYQMFLFLEVKPFITTQHLQFQQFHLPRKMEQILSQIHHFIYTE